MESTCRSGLVILKSDWAFVLWKSSAIKREHSSQAKCDLQNMTED